MNDEEEEIKSQRKLIVQLDKEAEERRIAAERVMEGLATILLWDYLTEEERNGSDEE